MNIPERRRWLEPDAIQPTCEYCFEPLDADDRCPACDQRAAEEREEALDAIRRALPETAAEAMASVDTE
jgi:hypothetical protein